MCGVRDYLVSSIEAKISGLSISDGVAKTELRNAKGTPESSFSLLELAATDDVEGFKRAVEYGGKVEDCGSWYCRKYGSNQMTWSQKTPAMIASLYGSLEVLQYILNHVSTHGLDVNKGCESDGVTALHCAAAGGSTLVVDVVKLLLSNGADPTSMDSQGLRPLDVMRVSPNLTHLKTTVEKLLKGSLEPGSPSPQEMFSLSPPESDSCILPNPLPSLKVGANSENKVCLELADYKCDAYSTSPLSVASLSSSPSTGGFFPYLGSSLKSCDAISLKASSDATEKEPSADPSILCMKNSMFATDEFRMFSFKVCPCSRAYSHDWTECPFVHPGENARRRDPRMYHYSCVPCPDFRKGACRRGDACEYAHGVFECWLHPAQYRTRLCKDGISCSRKVCFFAHTKEELRPMHTSSTGAAAVSPRAMSSVNVTSSSPHLGSTSCSTVMLPSFTQLNAQQSGLSTPSMLPVSINCSSGNWTQPSTPTSHLSGVGFQSSRLKAASDARDAFLEDLSRPSDFEGHLRSEFTSLSTRARLNAAVAASGCGTSSSRAGKLWNIGPSPTNLEEFFTSEVTSSPVSPSQVSLQSQIDTQMQSNKSACSQVMLSTFKQLQGNKATQWSPALIAAHSMLAQRDKRCQSSKELGAGLSFPDWGSPTGKPEWGVQADDLSKFRKSASFGLKTMEEPDLSWVQNLLKDGPLDGESPSNVYSVEVGCTGLRDVSGPSVLGSWMEQVQLDQIVA